MEITYNSKYSKEFEREEEEMRKELLIIEADEYESIMQSFSNMQE